jgi:dynein light chain LC8-type
MYTSTYPSSPARTSPAEVTPINYQTQSHLREHHQASTHNETKTMNDNTFSARRATSGYGNTSPSVASLPLHNPTSPRRYADNYNYSPPNTNRYQSAAYPSAYRSYGNDAEAFRSNTSRYDLSGNVRAYSYDNLSNDPSRPQSALNHSRNNLYYTSQPRREQYTDYEDDDDDLVVKSTDLPATYEQEMISLVRTAFRKHQITNQRELAGFLKRAADKTFTPCWHCIVGRQFSSYVTHEMNGFIYFTKGPLSILLFKSGA